MLSSLFLLPLFFVSVSLAHVSRELLIHVDRPCNIRCVGGHDCVDFADKRFRCVDQEYPNGLPVGAECTSKVATVQGITAPVSCGDGLVCFEGFCTYSCPGCGPNKLPKQTVWPSSNPAISGEDFCCPNDVWGFCRSVNDCGGAAPGWACTNGVCTPPWVTPGDAKSTEQFSTTTSVATDASSKLPPSWDWNRKAPANDMVTKVLASILGSLAGVAIIVAAFIYCRKRYTRSVKRCKGISSSPYSSCHHAGLSSETLPVYKLGAQTTA